MLKKIKQTMKGYSLVEILLAIAFFAMVIIISENFWVFHKNESFYFRA